MIITRNFLIYVIEGRITRLLAIMKANDGINPLNGLPFNAAIRAFNEWSLLRAASKALQEYSKL